MHLGWFVGSQGGIFVHKPAIDICIRPSQFGGGRFLGSTRGRCSRAEAGQSLITCHEIQSNKSNLRLGYMEGVLESCEALGWILGPPIGQGSGQDHGRQLCGECNERCLLV